MSPDGRTSPNNHDSVGDPLGQILATAVARNGPAIAAQFCEHFHAKFHAKQIGETGKFWLLVRYFAADPGTYKAGAAVLNGVLSGATSLDQALEAFPDAKIGTPLEE